MSNEEQHHIFKRFCFLLGRPLVHKVWYTITGSHVPYSECKVFRWVVTAPTYPIRCSIFLHEWIPINNICVLAESFLGYRMIPHSAFHHNVLNVIENLYNKVMEEFWLAGCEQSDVCKEFDCQVCQGNEFLPRVRDTSPGLFWLSRTSKYQCFNCSYYGCGEGCCCPGCAIDHLIRWGK